MRYNFFYIISICFITLLYGSPDSSLYWDEFGRLTNRVFKDSEGQPQACCTYTYNSEDLLIRETLTGNLTGSCEIPLLIQADGTPVDNGIESLSMVYTYGADRTLISCEPESSSSLAESDFSLSCADFIRDVCHVIWDHFYESSKHPWSALFDELGVQEEARVKMRNYARSFFGPGIYRFMGYDCHDKSETGTYGTHEHNDKVRITFMNGILTTKNMHLENLEIISTTHGDSRVHYVLLATEGWSADMAKMLGIKFGFYAGFQSRYAHELARVWRKLIEEMGGADGGGIIIHYAHSLGGTITDRARHLLTPEEQKMIRVTTFGSATLVENKGFDDVVNYVSIHDGVANNPILIDPLGHFRNFVDPNSNVIFLGRFFAWWFWPIDHLLNGRTYRTIMVELGEQFIEDFVHK